MITRDSLTTEIISPTEAFVNDSIANVIRRAERAQNDASIIRRHLVQHLIHEKQAEQAHATANCGTFLMFKRYNDAEQTAKLERANFCKHPVCPVCAWRRHLKYSNLINIAISHSTYAYLYHLVLAVPNVESLSREYLMRLKERGKSFVAQKLGCKSYISNLEIVCHGNGFHPHLHMLLDLPNFVPVSADWIKNMSAKWKKHFSKGLDGVYDRYAGFTFYITGSSKDESGNIALELTKYIVKGDISSEPENVETIARAIKGVRKMSTAGTFKKALQDAKECVALDTAEKLEHLSHYDWEYQIFNYINGKYERRPNDK